ncbi:hypothetical protein C5748_20015 [Phyllobacterium phragmitis]|uniref:FHA domain-containing protein n=1 Tax=Phyllobacterium phragmitis TaxID=2670329 RepID=A0A2S9IMJ6_9HYPH|nr:FHA domain-containing protein [Phyllobacterium phragmitis]PRD41748.1 hypothetical protein C5748_20015 [Phyllobacterium phragmitis]
MSSNSLSFPSATALSPAIVAKPGALALDVLSGLHQGVRAPVEGEACTIGASPTCDLVLADRDIAAEHLQLRFYGKQVAVNAIGGTVFIEGRPALQRGYGCRVKLPMTFMVGGAKLRIDRDRTGEPLVRRWGLYAAVVAVALVMVPIVAVQAGISGLLPQKFASPSDQLTVGSVLPAAAVQSDADVAAALRDKIEQANLGQLSLSIDGRRIGVSGQVAPDRIEDWRNIQRWFDRSHGGRYVLTSLVSTAAVTDAPRFVFQAVFFGRNPYVVDARGERRYPGAALQDGWMLKAIENGQILVVRGGQEFKLTL